MKCPFCQIKTNLNHVYQCKNSKISDRIDSMGGFNDTQFENDIKEIYENENTYTLVIGHESYAIQNLKSGSLDDINKAITEYKLYVVKGVQLDGKQLGDTTLSVNRTSYKEV